MRRERQRRSARKRDAVASPAPDEEQQAGQGLRLLHGLGGGAAQEDGQEGDRVERGVGQHRGHERAGREPQRRQAQPDREREGQRGRR